MVIKNKIRVLIVDDSFFIRKLLRGILSEDPGIEVLGEAGDGLKAAEEAMRLKPDVITMDYNMPKANGAEAIRVILEKVRPVPAIIMVSAYTHEGAEATFESLRAGAVDFIAKPSGELSFDLEKIRDELIAKIKAAARANVSLPRAIAKRAVKKARKFRDGTIRAIVLGASTGGPPVLEDILMSPFNGASAAFFIVQHMPPHFTKTFADRLNRISFFSVKEAEDGDEVQAGIGFVAPGDFHMKVKDCEDGRCIIELSKSEPRHNLRPAIDVTMESIASSFGEKTIGVILTGMGVDGCEGMARIKEVGGYTIVQDPKTAVIDSMPRAVIDGGFADEVLSPDEIMKSIVKLIS